MAPENLGGVRGAIDEGDTLAMAEEAFAQEDYQRVTELLAQLPEDSSQEALLLRAHSFFAKGDFAVASEDFSALVTGGIYRRDAEWYGLLAALAVEGSDKNDLKERLDSIRKNERHSFREAADSLWEELN